MPWSVSPPGPQLDHRARVAQRADPLRCPPGEYFSDTTLRDPRERFDFDGYEDLDADMKRKLSDASWWFDTSALTPEETADRIIREAGHRARVN